MDVKKVYIVFGGSFTKEQVLREIEDDKFSFYFGTRQEYIDQVEQIKVADEVWTFGDCRAMADFKYAKATGKEIWVMG